MNAEIFSEWLRRQGHTVYRTESSYWYNAGPRTLQAFPYHWLIDPSEKELNQLMRTKGIAALRYSTPIDNTKGMVSYHVVLHRPYSFNTLRSRTRTSVRKGLNNCQVEQISFKRLAEEGWDLQYDTLKRQNRLRSMNQDDWRRICLAAEGLDGFEAWGAVVEGELAATILTARIEDTCYLLYAQSHRKFFNLYVNNALFFSVTCDMLEREGVNGIFYSLHSLDAPDSTNEFKFRMSLVPLPVRQRVVLHPVIQPLANSVSYGLVASMQKRFPSNTNLAKVEGMLRFYMEGKRPLNEQVWPDCLDQSKLEASEAEDLST